MALTPAKAAVGLDAALANVTHIAFSENGTTEAHAKVGRAPLSGTPKLKAATAVDPSVKSNNGATESPLATGAGTATHWAFCESGVGGTADLATTWNPLTTPVPFIVGGKITVADGMCKEQCAADNDPNVDAS